MPPFVAGGFILLSFPEDYNPGLPYVAHVAGAPHIKETDAIRAAWSTTVLTSISAYRRSKPQGSSSRWERSSSASASSSRVGPSATTTPSSISTLRGQSWAA